MYVATLEVVAVVSCRNRDLNNANKQTADREKRVDPTADILIRQRGKSTGGTYTINAFHLGENIPVLWCCARSLTGTVNGIEPLFALLVTPVPSLL